MSVATVRRWAEEHTEVLSLAAIVVAIQFLPERAPGGIYGLGIVFGARLAVQAVGLVLVYRANRIINFAQVAVGALAGAFFVNSVRFQPLYRLVREVCPPCMGTRVSPALENLNYILSLVLAMGLAVGISWIIYVFVVKRFANAPRLVLTVATIFIAQILAATQIGLFYLLSSSAQRKDLSFVGKSTKPPFDISFSVSPATFHLADILTLIVIPLVIAGLVVYLKRSSTGTAIRAAAENADRASTLGVNVSKVTSRVWLLAGTLSGVGGLLEAMSSGQATTTPLAIPVLVRMLAVGAVARLVSLPMAAVAAVVFGVLDAAVQWSFGSIVVLDGLFLVIIAVILLLQRARVSRAELEQASSWRAAREVRPIPRELRDLPTVRNWVRGGRIVGTIALLAFPWVMSPGQTNIAAVVMIYGIVGLSLLVLTGWAGQISLGQFAFAAVGGFIVGVWNAPFLVELIAAALVGAVVAVLVGLPALKLRGLHLAVTTLAFALAATQVLLNPRYLGKNLPQVVRRPAFLGMDLDDERVFYYFVLLVMAGVIAAVVGMRRSRTARALVAGRDNELAAQSFGIDLVRARLGAFAISGFLAALAGGMFAYSQHAVNIQAFSPDVSLTIFLNTIIGGLGSVASPLVGTLYFGLLRVFDASAIVVFSSTGVLGILLLSLIPGGLGTLVFDVRDAMLRRVARRYRIVVPSLLADVRVDLDAQTSPIAPKVRPGGGEVFVPRLYRLPHQWAIGNGEKSEERTRA